MLLNGFDANGFALVNGWLLVAGFDENGLALVSGLVCIGLGLLLFNGLPLFTGFDANGFALVSGFDCIGLGLLLFNGLWLAAGLRLAFGLREVSGPWCEEKGFAEERGRRMELMGDSCRVWKLRPSYAGH